MPGPASLSNRHGQEDWPQSLGSSRATRCWTATGSACRGRTLRKQCTCSKTRGDSICSSERALPRVRSLNLIVEFGGAKYKLLLPMSPFQISSRPTELPTIARRWPFKSPPATTAPPRAATTTNNSSSSSSSSSRVRQM